ncbi:MAG: hypothetical protein ACN23H_01790 [Candidatus Phytoplasma vitis]|nr:MAG: hypothetical protein M6G77_01470 [Candidatus Phytoplasma vitis]
MNKILESLKRHNSKLALLDETPELINILQEFCELQLLSLWNCDGDRYFYTDSHHGGKYGVADVCEVLNYRFRKSVCFSSLFNSFINSLKQIEEFTDANKDKLNELYNILEEKYKIDSDELMESM